MASAAAASVSSRLFEAPVGPVSCAFSTACRLCHSAYRFAVYAPVQSCNHTAQTELLTARAALTVISCMFVGNTAVQFWGNGRGPLALGLPHDCCADVKTDAWSCCRFIQMAAGFLHMAAGFPFYPVSQTSRYVLTIRAKSASWVLSMAEQLLHVLFVFLLCMLNDWHNQRNIIRVPVLCRH